VRRRPGLPAAKRAACLLAQFQALCCARVASDRRSRPRDGAAASRASDPLIQSEAARDLGCQLGTAAAQLCPSRFRASSLQFSWSDDLRARSKGTESSAPARRRHAADRSGAAPAVCRLCSIDGARRKQINLFSSNPRRTRRAAFATSRRSLGPQRPLINELPGPDYEGFLAGRRARVRRAGRHGRPVCRG
jgi:hypothetical protein